MWIAYLWEALLGIYFCRHFIAVKSKKAMLINGLFLIIYTVCKDYFEHYYYPNLLWMVISIILFLLIHQNKDYRRALWHGLLFAVLIQTGREIVYGCIPTTMLYNKYIVQVRLAAMCMKAIIVYIISNQLKNINDFHPGKFDYLLITIPLLILEYSRHFTVQIRNGLIITGYDYLAFFVMQITIVLSLISIVWRIGLDNQIMQQRKLEMMIQSQYEQIKQKSEDDANIRRMYHDIKNIVGSLNSTDTSLDAVKTELIDAVKEYRPAHHCDHPLLNTLLAQKVKEASDKGIALNVFVSIDQLYDLSAIDVISIVGNLLDNAIEATAKTTNKQPITIKGAISSGHLLLKVDNFYQEDIQKDGDRFITSKLDKQNHGIGLQSVQYLVSKHNGRLDIQTDHQIFKVTVILPISYSE